jgi:beta-1,4-mannosyltransferase
MKTAFISPFINETNDYINQVKLVLHGCGYQVKPFSFKTLASRSALGLFDPRNVVLVNWMESRVFSEGRDGAKIRPSGLIQFLVYVVVLAIARAKFIYFVHDHAVHDLTGWRRQFSILLIALLRKLATLRVVHDPSFTARYQALYLPHPLYQDRKEQAATETTQAAPLRAGILGAIRPYKRIEHIIAVWPPGPELVIRGRADKAYETHLREVMAQRRPDITVDLSTGFMSREAFDQTLNELDALILPHADESMLVSGAFFEAIGLVPFIIARETPFTNWAKTQFSGVLTFTNDAQLIDCVQQAAAHQVAARTSLPQSAAQANALFGMASCIKQYGAVLRSV